MITKAQEAKNKTEEAAEKEKNDLAELENYMNGIEGYSEEFKVNVPKLQEGMIPVYYDETAKVWRRADETNKGTVKWYDYEAKQWANIVTVSDEDANLREAEVATEIPMEKITTFFVWIPRYAYSITEGYKQGSTEEAEVTGKIDVTFLKGSSNIGSDNVTYETDYDESEIEAGEETPKIVHPGFTSGNSQLTGIWVAKFEASGLNGGQAVGNASSSSSIPVTVGSDTYVRILPSQISWRHITIGEAEFQSMRMSENADKYGWTSSINSHLIKNSEWGAVAYLCYSKYGSIPKINGSGTSISGYYYNMYTGAGPANATDEGSYYSNFSENTNGYNTELGGLSSTTGNVYGIYDMAGGAWEMVAAYLDNGNGKLNTNGQSTTKLNEETVKYIENGILNSQYSSLWEDYEVSEEEKDNKIQVDGVGEISQNTLWSGENKSEAYNNTRKRLTKANYDNMAKHKGIGVNEVGTEFSYYAPFGTAWSWGWFKTVKDTSADSTSQEYARAWDNDYTLINHVGSPFVLRGGHCDSKNFSGVLAISFTHGNVDSPYGFRPVLTF